MPRRPRYYLPGIPCHITQRGNNRQACFFGNQDHSFYLRCLAEASVRHACAVHAYVLMTNHVHLLVTPSRADSIPRMMQSIGRRYVQSINLLRDRTGTLWEGRHHASLIESERYFLTCARYIELNPVRAGMVRHPGEYCWSSYPGNASGVADPLITFHPVYESLGETCRAQQEAYRDLFRQTFDEADLKAIRLATNLGTPLGSEHFKSEVDRQLVRPVSYKQRGRPRSRGK